MFCTATRRLFPLLILFGLAACGGSSSYNLDLQIRETETNVPHGVYTRLHLDSSATVPLTATWEVIQAPDGGTGVFRYNNVASRSSDVLLEVPGVYKIRVTARTPSGNSASDEITLTAYNSAPTANIYRDPSDGWTNIPTLLDGSYSRDGNSDSLTYAWQVKAAPDGAVYSLESPSAAQTGFVTDTPGIYRLGLTVRDEWGGEGTALSANIEVWENIAPRILLRQLPAILDDEAVTLDAGPTYDSAGSLTFEWEMVSSSDGSQPDLVVNDDVATFLPGEDNEYQVRLTVTDGVLTSERVFTVGSVDKFLDLPDSVADMEYDTTNERLIIASASDPSLILVNPADPFDVTRVSLPQIAEAMSLSPDGAQVAVTHGAQIFVVDLSSGAVARTLYTSLQGIGAVVHGGNGYVYVIPGESAMGELRSIEIDTGIESLSPRRSLGSYAKKRPGKDIVYAGLYRYDIQDGIANYQETSFWPSSDRWFSDDGTRMFLQYGDVHQLDDDPELDGGHVVGLEHNENSIRSADSHIMYPRVIAVSHYPADGAVDVIEGAPTSGAVGYPAPELNYTLRTYDDSTYRLQREVGMPLWHELGKAYELKPVFVFHDDTGQLFVVAETEGEAATRTVILKY